ncbi:ABC transporter substrate-binding protein [Actinophytocola sp.]|uniref:ABC transporter substrate-binding protein n=1 Tax=Actinophytocola sp. TaxID=1872138 RepID=UPI003D6C3227
MTVTFGGKVMTWAPALLTERMGFAEEEGLDVEHIVSQQGTASALAALISGSTDAVLAGAPASMAPVREGAPVKLIGGPLVGYGVEITVSNEFLKRAGVTLDDPLDKRIAALRGAKLGIYNPGDSVDQLYRAILPKAGIDPDRDVEIVTLQNAAGELAALAKGQIDAMGASPPGGAQAEQEKFGTILIDGREVPGLDVYPYGVLSVNTRDLTGDKAELIKSYVRALNKALQTIRDDPESTKRHLHEEFPDLDDFTFDITFEDMRRSMPDSLELSEDRFQSLAKFAKDQGKDLGLDYGELIDTTLVKSALDGK